VKFLQFIKENPAVALTLASAYIYLCGYEYESGYLQEFNVSNAYLSFDVSTVLRDSIEVITIACLVIFANELLVGSLKNAMKKSNGHYQTINILIKLIILIGVTLMSTAAPTVAVIAIIGSVVGIFIMYVVWTVVTFIIEKKRKKQAEPKTVTANTASTETFNSPIYKIAYGIWYPFIICTALGAGKAYNQNQFEIIHDTADYVIIRKYGDEIICKELTKNHRLGKTTKIYKLSDSKPIIASSVDLENLSVSHQPSK
jgi:hypothetical protein